MMKAITTIGYIIALVNDITSPQNGKYLGVSYSKGYIKA